MSDWNPVTSKKKPPSVETDASTKRPLTTQDIIDLSTTTRIRAQFSLHSGYKNFNPVLALRGLFTAMKATQPEIPLYDVTGTNVYDKPEDLPDDPTTFEKGFPVFPHLRRTGGSGVHVHFRIKQPMTIDLMKKQPQFLHYLQRNRIWLAPHQFSDGSIASVGFIFLKSPALTHLENYVTSLRMHLVSTKQHSPPEHQSEDNTQDDGSSMKDTTDIDKTTAWTTVQEVP